MTLAQITALARQAADRANAQRAEWRNALAYAMVNPGKGAEGDPGAHATHEGWMRGATQAVGQHLRPGATRAALEAVGWGNEAVSGSLAWLGGHGFYGPQGFDREDIEANRRGMAQGFEQLQRGPSLGEIIELNRR